MISTETSNLISVKKDERLKVRTLNYQEVVKTKIYEEQEKQKIAILEKVKALQKESKEKKEKEEIERLREEKLQKEQEEKQKEQEKFEEEKNCKRRK